MGSDNDQVTRAIIFIRIVADRPAMRIDDTRADRAAVLIARAVKAETITDQTACRSVAFGIAA